MVGVDTGEIGTGNDGAGAITSGNGEEDGLGRGAVDIEWSEGALL